MEQDEKFENQLNLALDLSEEEREKSKDLDAGYDKETDQWEIIFRYAGTLDTIRWSDTTRIEPLSMGYAIDSRILYVVGQESTSFIDWKRCFCRCDRYRD